MSCLAGYGFSRFRFRGKEALFFLVIILMMTPYQVTLVSNYLMLDRLGLVGSWWALILPAVFSPFGVFLLRQVFDSVFLSRLNGQDVGLLCTCGVLTALPVVLLFLYYDQELTTTCIPAKDNADNII